ncbi:iron-sulfur cluster co-chaperone protein HscB-like protein, mitochondrial isoform X2 [Andrena cerasifolii]|uniref:iron-sulfur cluster co-chaperone protein HscB-like protein, mitochondrial isoform X2 n=1 Tax=Andrena cerasifolii TaxID=2819439 RepID=UPI0040384C93
MYLRRTFLNLARKYSISYLNSIKQQRNLHSYHVVKNYVPYSVISTNVSQYSSDSPLKCWNCNYMYKSDLFCSKCKALQEPPENLTYFDIMGIPKSYDVTLTEIQRKYKELQKLLHPDKFGNKTEKEQQFSEKFSSLANKAYSTLSHPLKRGLYMLKLNGVTIPDETDNVNAEFLMEIMEKNEEVEDAMTDTGKIKKLVQENEAVLKNLSMEIADAFRGNDIKKAETLLIRMKYFDSISTRLKKLKHDLGIVE